MFQFDLESFRIVEMTFIVIGIAIFRFDERNLVVTGEDYKSL